MIIAKKDRKYKVIYENNNLRELLRHIEEIAFDFLLSNEVQDEKYFKKSKSGYYKSHKMGYFMVAGYDKITIYNKYIDKGYLYNSIEVKKIITYILIRPIRRLPAVYYENEWESDLYKSQYFADVHKELLLKQLGDLNVKTDVDVIN